VIFKPLPLKDAFLVEPERLKDNRGFFARSFCFKEFEKNGLNPRLAQCNISFNITKGTLRGMHYQSPPFMEAKLIRCTKGSVHDVMVDLRSDSKTYLRHYGVRLDADNRLMVYVPKGFAHGFITLEDHSEVFYQMSEFYSSDNAHGFRWDDTCFKIEWPLSPTVISDKDSSYPDYIP
jgi:dTDP-4-dehydrorhamnose 3,5-epimerase